MTPSTRSNSWAVSPKDIRRRRKSPDSFRILIYFPDDDRWIMSEPCERFTFDSYFTATVDLSGEGLLSVAKEPVHWAGAFFLRLIVTLVIELLIALAFSLRKKKQLTVICVTNIITQIVLNLFLMSVYPTDRYVVLVFIYPLCEIIVFILEALIYSRLLSDERFSRRRFALYAFVANLASFLIGVALPQIPYVRW